MVDVYLFRHAHVDYAPPARITAHNPLTPLGHEMAARLAERASEWRLQHLFVSTMLRAQQTADAFRQRYPDLAVTNLGEFEEVGPRDLDMDPGELPSEDTRTWDLALVSRAAVRMRQRVISGWGKVMALAAEAGLERVAIISHGGPLNLLLRHLLGYGDVAINDCWFNLDWTGTSCLRCGPNNKAILWVNDARHIDVLCDRLPPGRRG